MDQIQAMDMTWDIVDETCASSLMLFLSRHCTSPSSPPVDLEIEGLPKSTLWPGIMMAVSCSNLRIFQCTSLQLDRSTAQACLRLLPPTLQELEIYVPGKNVDEPAWGRLTSLITLSLQWPRVAAPSFYQGSGLARLPALEDLDLDTAPNFDSAAPATDKLPGTSFASAHLKTLRFNDDPFEGGLDLCKLPALLTIHIYLEGALPKWLEGQPFHCLRMATSSQLSSIQLSGLKCTKLWIFDGAGGPAWDIADLLKMPNLETLAAETSEEALKAPIYLHGGHEEFLAFIRLRVILAVPARLRLQGPGVKGSEVPLGWNGHASICLRATCRPHGG